MAAYTSDQPAGHDPLPPADDEVQRKKLIHSSTSGGSKRATDGGRGIDDDDDEEEATFDANARAESNELYSEHQSFGSRPWWKANFFVSAPVLFGTWDGVFTSCMINIFGVLIFLRMGWMVGNAGLGFSILIILMTISVALVAILSAIGVCQKCHMESGGIYFLLSYVLGARIGASIGILYCFGQAVACSLYVVGFGESIASLLNYENVWIARAIAVTVLLILSGINVAGVKWVIRLQLVLLVVLFIAVLDFAVGSFVHTDPVHGFIGYRMEILKNNSSPDYENGQTFFTVFGVFFPTATGVFAGINMSGDLRNPSRSIPLGTLSAVAVSTLLYLVFALFLGATCLRSALQVDYMIAEKVSIVGFLFLAGLYISSISSSMGGLYGSPRILQSIANDGVIPIIQILSKGRGANKVPVLALIVITLIALVFIFVGEVNTLGPIVTMPFMLTYAAVDYSHFILLMSSDTFDRREAFDQKGAFDQEGSDSKSLISTLSYEYGSVRDVRKDDKKDDQMTQQRNKSQHKVQQNAAADDKIDATETKSLASEMDASTTLLGSGNKDSGSQMMMKQKKSIYMIFCNRWISLIGALVTLVAMFGIQWIYALVNIIAVFIVYIYIGQANSGVFPGIAEFSLLKTIGNGIKRCCRLGSQATPEQVVVTRGTPAMETTSAQLTEDNEDFATRGRYHQSEIVKGKNFDDYAGSE